MSERTKIKASDEAAKAFYGQNESDFAEQIKRYSSADPRLAKVFENTRARFLRGEFATSGY